MPIFRIKSVNIYTGQKKFTRIYPWDPWQISGMSQCKWFTQGQERQEHSSVKKEIPCCGGVHRNGSDFAILELKANMSRRVLSKKKELVRKGDAMLIAQMNTLWRVRVLSKGRSLTAIVMLFTAAFFIRSCTWGYTIWSHHNHKVLLRNTPCQRRSQQGWLHRLGGFGRQTWGHPVLLETLWWQDRQTLLRKKLVI